MTTRDLLYTYFSLITLVVFINILSCCRYHIIHLQPVGAVQASPHCLSTKVIIMM